MNARIEYQESYRLIRLFKHYNSQDREYLTFSIARHQNRGLHAYAAAYQSFWHRYDYDSSRYMRRAHTYFGLGLGYDSRFYQAEVERWWHDRVSCDVCGGHGTTTQYYFYGSSMGSMKETPCRACQGTGLKPEYQWRGLPF